MTPKEKALEICQLMGWAGMASEELDFTTLPLEVAKVCAKHYCDGILDCLNRANHSNAYIRPGYVGSYEDVDVSEKYWHEVKEEVDKIGFKSKELKGE